MKKPILLFVINILLFNAIMAISTAQEDADFKNIDYVENPSMLQDYAMERGMVVTMSDNVKFESYSSETGVFVTKGPHSTAFTIDELGYFYSQGAQSININQDGSITLKLKNEDVVLNNVRLEGDRIIPKGAGSYILFKGMKIYVNKGYVSLGEGSLEIAAGSELSLDSNVNSEVMNAEIDITAKEPTSLMFDSVCTDRNKNCVGIIKDTLSISGSGIDVSLRIGKDGKPLHKIKNLMVYPKSKDYEPEIRVIEKSDTEASKMLFSKAGITFYRGKRPKSIDSIDSSFINRKGEEVMFMAIRTDTGWNYEICKDKDCRNVGEDEIASALREPSPDYVMSNEEYNDADYASAEEINMILVKYDSPLLKETFEVDGRKMGAAEYMVYLGNKYDINPFLLLTRLEVEQSLITSKKGDMDRATGCGCSDNKKCIEMYSGIQKQLECTARLMSEYEKDIDERGKTGSKWGPGKKMQTKDYVSVTPSNMATAALYTYNPYAGPVYGSEQKKWGGVGSFYDNWNMFDDDLAEIRRQEEASSSEPMVASAG